jgi:hypothetical protein
LASSVLISSGVMSRVILLAVAPGGAQYFTT